MTKQNIIKLQKSYRKYQKIKNRKNSLLTFFRSFMPDIILRTTKLEGEQITKKMVSSL